MAQGKPASGLHKACIPLRECNGHTGGYERAPSAGLQPDRFSGHEITSGIARGGVGRHAERTLTKADRHLHHGHTLSAPAADVSCVATLRHVLAWIDLEMTGLDPTRHVIVEIASLITDDDLTIVAEGPDLVIGASESELSAMDDFVTKMHTHSGLLEDIRSSSLTRAEAEDATLRFLAEHIAQAQSVPLCGNSIGTDRRFLATQMPSIESFLHYRSVDVSTIKELARRWAPSVIESAPTKDGAHRALDDIKESLNELRHYRTTFFNLPKERS